jgi:hypothetical protein
MGKISRNLLMVERDQLALQAIVESVGFKKDNLFTKYFSKKAGFHLLNLLKDKIFLKLKTLFETWMWRENISCWSWRWN